MSKTDVKKTGDMGMVEAHDTSKPIIDNTVWICQAIWMIDGNDDADDDDMCTTLHFIPREGSRKCYP